MKIARLITAILLSILLSTAARAELKWEQTSIELNPGPGEKEAVGHFKYQNVGKTSIRFKSVHSSCGCTAAQSQKELVAPGEKGEITATFKIGNRTGVQVKGVTVETDESSNKKTTLTLRTVIGETLGLQPTFVYWQTGEEAKPKTIIARVAKGVPITHLDVTSSSPEFLFKVERTASPGEFHINVQPRQTAKPVFGALAIKTDYPPESPKTFNVTARVTGTSPSAAR